MHGKNLRCAGCGEEISIFDLDEAMECPHANDYRGVIRKRMPVFSSREEMDNFLELGKKGGWDLGGWEINEKEKQFSPQIPAVYEMMEDLMQHQSVDGAWYHFSSYVCKKCVEKSKFCTACSTQHDATCPVCGSALEAISTE